MNDKQKQQPAEEPDCPRCGGIGEVKGWSGTWMTDLVLCPKCKGEGHL